jgi:hypothetical protein
MVRIFETYMAGEAPRTGLADAVVLAKSEATCLLCFERAPHDCHRAIVAGLIRAETGQTIRHL